MAAKKYEEKKTDKRLSNCKATALATETIMKASKTENSVIII
jgi:hypothetical protein